MSKRLLAIILLTAMLISSLPIVSSAVTTDEITLAMDTLKSTVYRDGYFWCGGDVNTAIHYNCGQRYRCTCNKFNGASQCHGFALIMASKVVGSYPTPRLADYRHGLVSNGWTCYTSSAIGKSALCNMGLRPGDIIRAAYTSDYADGHTAIVWKVEGNKVYVAECWGSVYCKLYWGGFNYYYDTFEEICAEYSYVALWRNSSVQQGSGECPHKYKVGYEKVHPHREYKNCSYCQDTFYTGNYGTLEGCVCCNGTHDYISSYESAHPHKEVLTCCICGNYVYSGKTKSQSSCIICQDLPYDLKIGFEKPAYKVGEGVKVSFSAANAVKYSITVKKDGEKYASVSNTDSTSYSFVPNEVGIYTVSVTAYSSNQKSLAGDSSPLNVSAPISAVLTEEDGYTVSYSLSLERTAAEKFCEDRAMTLDSHSSNSFKARLTFDKEKMGEEYIAQDYYLCVPASLSHGEIVDFCRIIGGEFVSITDRSSEALLKQLCNESGCQGVMLNADDCLEEGVWRHNGSKLEYLNWNILYSREPNKYKNYLFMYPGGTVIDSYAKAREPHGFIVKLPLPAEYSDNGDGTLTLTRVRGIESAQLMLPDSHNGKPVTAIADSAFGNGTYGNLLLPSPLTSMAGGVFEGADIYSISVHRDSLASELLMELGISIPYSIYFPFTDVKSGTWYREGVEYCYMNRYISGISPTRFSPHTALTREQFVLILAMVAGADLEAYKDADTGMSDVKSGRWYSAAIAWGVSEGYISGVAEGVFGLGQYTTREQLARLFCLYAEKCGMDTSAGAALECFEDEDRVSHWAYDNMAWAVSVGLISGTSPTTLDPGASATRAQAARIFMLFDSIRNSAG